MPRRRTSALREISARAPKVDRIIASKSRARWAARGKPNDKVLPGWTRVGRLWLTAEQLAERAAQLAALRAGASTTASAMRAWIIPGETTP